VSSAPRSFAAAAEAPRSQQVSSAPRSFAAAAGELAEEKEQPKERAPEPLLSPSVSPEKSAGSGQHLQVAGTAQTRTLEDDVAICQEWIELVTKRTCTQAFDEELKSGELLCELAISISAGSVRRYNKEPKTPFKRLENLSTFIQACRSFGVMEYELFSTSDVLEGKGLSAVTRCLFALGRSIQTTCPQFAGPHLGMADHSKRRGLMRTQSGSILVSSPVPLVPQQWSAQRVTVDSHNLDRGKWGRAAASPSRTAA